jgi:hypothetical protein
MVLFSQLLLVLENPDTGAESSLDSPAMGYASAVKVEEGIYFVNGYFVSNDDTELLVLIHITIVHLQKLVFVLMKMIITPEEDSSLYDNAIGSSNFSAPGAHRLKINLRLKKYDL